MGSPQHPVGLECFLKVLSQVAAIVDDSAKLLHLQGSGSADTETAKISWGSVGTTRDGRQGANPVQLATTGATSPGQKIQENTKEKKHC